MVKCVICERKEAVHKCRLCGRPVCDDDYDQSTGLCSVCTTTRCEICGKYPAIGYCMICGRVGCEDCLIQVTLVSYVCKECMRKGLYKIETGGRKASTRNT